MSYDVGEITPKHMNANCLYCLDSNIRSFRTLDGVSGGRINK